MRELRNQEHMSGLWAGDKKKKFKSKKKKEKKAKKCSPTFANQCSQMIGMFLSPSNDMYRECLIWLIQYMVIDLLSAPITGYRNKKIKNRKVSVCTENLDAQPVRRPGPESKKQILIVPCRSSCLWLGGDGSHVVLRRQRRGECQWFQVTNDWFDQNKL